MRRINLTQYESTPEQECEPRTKELADQIRLILTFEMLPSRDEILGRAWTLADIAAKSGATEAMIDGAAYLMLFLDPALRMRGIEPVYAFSKRETEEKTQKNGTVLKVSTFRHMGFIRLGFSAQVTFSLKGRGGANEQEKSARKVTEKR